MQAVQQVDLAVHVCDVVLEVLSGDVYLLAELSEHSCQLPEESGDTKMLHVYQMIK